MIEPKFEPNLPTTFTHHYTRHIKRHEEVKVVRIRRDETKPNIYTKELPTPYTNYRSKWI